MIAGLILSVYVYLLFSQTILCRSQQFKYSHYLMPFWSYQAILDGRHELIADNLLNVAIFIPIGLLFAMVFRSIRCWIVLLGGFVISFIIEFLQFVLNRGNAEIDDVMHNVLGSLIGYGFYSLIKYGVEKIYKQRMAVL